MNIQQAKRIPLKCLVEKLGGKFCHKDTHGSLWYFSPFRPDERTASFKIDEKTNKWHDFARINKVDAHGDIIDLWTDYHNLPRRDGASIKQALRSLKEILSHDTDTFLNIKQRQQNASKTLRYKLLKQPGKIWIDSLKKELARRNLSLAVVQGYLKQACIEDDKTKKRYYGFALRNDKGGYEISIPNPYKQECFKTVVSPKAITTIRGGDDFNAYVFEGFWDALTWLAMNKDNLKIGTLYILNSTSLTTDLANQLIQSKNTVKHIFLFMDNDNAGLKAETTLLDRLEPYNFTIGTMNKLYEGYKDLSDYWMSNETNKVITSSKSQMDNSIPAKFKI